MEARIQVASVQLEFGGENPEFGSDPGYQMRKERILVSGGRAPDGRAKMKEEKSRVSRRRRPTPDGHITKCRKSFTFKRGRILQASFQVCFSHSLHFETKKD